MLKGNLLKETGSLAYKNMIFLFDLGFHFVGFFPFCFETWYLGIFPVFESVDCSQTVPVAQANISNHTGFKD